MGRNAFENNFSDEEDSLPIDLEDLGGPRKSESALFLEELKEKQVRHFSHSRAQLIENLERVVAEESNLSRGG